MFTFSLKNIFAFFGGKKQFLVGFHLDEDIKNNKVHNQNVKFDSSTGKMYEELGNHSSSNTTSASVSTPTIPTATPAMVSSSEYYQGYQSYPYTQQYMSNFGYGSSAASNYDRAATAAAVSTAMYNPYHSPGAFVPHSAINLSVKSGETSSQHHSSLDLSEASNSYLNPQVFGSSTSTTRNQNVTNASPQILDLTRPGGTTGSLLDTVSAAAVGTGGTSNTFSPATVTDGTTSSKGLEKSTSKLEQTEPMDFSSGQSMSFAASRGGSGSGFDATFSSRSSAITASTSTDLSRFRASGYSSFGLGAAASYNSLLSNGYSSTGYSPYSQSSYGCLNYPNSAFATTGDPTSFSLSSALTGTGSARYLAYGISLLYRYLKSSCLVVMPPFQQDHQEAKMAKNSFNAQHLGAMV